MTSQISPARSHLRRVALTAAMPVLLAGCNWISLVSQSDSGEQGDAPSWGATVSADGRYLAFTSQSENLVTGDTNGLRDVFLHDTLAGTTTLVSRSTAGEFSNLGGNSPSISADGRYIAFTSFATNLVPADINNVSDVFVHDRQTGITSRISIDSSGVEANGESGAPAISADGRYIAFQSEANNLVSNDTNSRSDIFVRDRANATTSRVSVDDFGNQLWEDSYSPAISGDGRYIAMQTGADIYLHYRDGGTTTLVSDREGGLPYTSSDPSISYDGRYLAFASRADRLVPGDTNDDSDIFLYDSAAGAITRISVTSAGAEADNDSHSPSISADGRFIAFGSSSYNLVPGVSGRNIFLHDRETGATTLLSSDAFGVPAEEVDDGYGGGIAENYGAAISGNGRYVAFETLAPNLVPDVYPGQATQIVMKAIPVITIDGISPAMIPIGATTEVTITGGNFLQDAVPAIDGDDKHIDNVTVVNESTITMDVTVLPGAAPGARSVTVSLFGTGPGALTGASRTCTDCLTVF